MVRIKTAGGASAGPPSQSEGLGPLISRGSLLPMISNEALVNLALGR